MVNQGPFIGIVSELLDGKLDVTEIRFRLGNLCLFPEGDVRGDSDGRQDANDSDIDNQLEQSKSF